MNLGPVGEKPPLETEQGGSAGPCVDIFLSVCVGCGHQRITTLRVSSDGRNRVSCYMFISRVTLVYRYTIICCGRELGFWV